MIQKSESSIKTVVLQTLTRIIVYGLLMVLLNQLIYLDAQQQGQEYKFLESTFTEWSQQFILLLMAAIFAHCAYHYAQLRSLSILLSGIASVGLVREFNNFFKTNVFDGAWQIVASIVICVMVYFLWQHRIGFWRAFDKYRQSFSFGILLAGFLITFIFSRIYGRTELWETIMEDRYFRSVKNASEESIELLGYGIMVIAAIEFFILAKSISKGISDR